MLREADGKGSIKRVIAFLFSCTFIGIVIFIAYKTTTFDHFSQILLCVMILTLLGLVAAPQILQAIGMMKGNSGGTVIAAPAPPVPEPSAGATQPEVVPIQENSPQP